MFFTKIGYFHFKKQYFVSFCSSFPLKIAFGRSRQMQQKGALQLMPLSKESFYLFLIWHRTEDEPAGLSECANQLLSLSFSSTFQERISKNSYSVSRSVIFRHVAHKVTYCGAFWRRNLSLFWYTFGYCHFLVHFWRV